MKIHIRQATSKDAKALASIEVASWRTAYRGLMPDDFLDELSEADKTLSWRRNLLIHEASNLKQVLVAIYDNDVVGFVRIGSASDDNTLGLVYLLYVLPEYWRHGIGTQLMTVAMETLMKLGMNEAILWVLCDNKRARQFYERLDWKPTEQKSSDIYGNIQLEAICYRKA